MNETKRLISLDAFRGFTIAAMIMVNNPGSWEHVYKPLLHAEWNGLTPTDLIFPFFIFIVGVSITLAFTKKIEANVSYNFLYRKIVTRSLKIFAVGIFLWLFPDFDFSSIRYAGVLQRIAIVFFICSIIFLNTKWKTQLITGSVILVIYWLAMVLIPIPGQNKAMLEPGINLAAWIDKILLPGVMWQKTWDPEGLLSTIPAIATGISGMLAGTIILKTQYQEKKIIRLFLAGFVLSILGYLLSLVFPVNKNLWSSSFVLVTSGFAYLTLASSIFVVDVLGRKRFTKPGVIFGANAITVYVLSGMLSPVFYSIKIGSASLNIHFLNLIDFIGFSAKFGSLLFALIYISLNFIPAYFLYRKKIFIKL